MSFWDDTVSTAKDVLEIAAKKTEKTVEVQKMRFAVQKQKNKVAKAYETLGRCYYDSCKEEDGSKELLSTLCCELDQELATLKKIKLELSKRQNQD